MFVIQHPTHLIYLGKHHNILTVGVINPLSDGLQIKAVLMGGGIECPPSKNLENEATESCEGSK